NADRTVHLSEKAVQPPGKAKPDLDIFLDYAARMEFRDKEGGPLVTWHHPESAFEAWKRCSAGRPCDYTGLSYAMLRGGSGIQWPVNEQAPEGTERLYTEGISWAHPDVCENYGKDLVTGASDSDAEYRSLNPDGKAMLKAAAYLTPHEEPSQEYPFQLTTGRTIYHFHTRTKTGRVPQLNEAAPDVWVEISASDAERLDLAEGDLVEVSTPRGAMQGRLRITELRPGVIFVPFHYGYWDTPAGTGPDSTTPGRAANETTVTDWDPASKQPLFKTAAAALTLLARSDGMPSPAPTTTASAPTAPHGVPATGGGPTAHVSHTARERKADHR
ncbi:molybdopterin oxidoreductase family protein, partial [Streptomyces mirabilis]